MCDDVHIVCNCSVIEYYSRQAGHDATWWRHQMGTFSALQALCDAGDLRRHRAHYGVTVIMWLDQISYLILSYLFHTFYCDEDSISIIQQRTRDRDRIA